MALTGLGFGLRCLRWWQVSLGLWVCRCGVCGCGCEFGFEFCSGLEVGVEGFRASQFV